MKMPQFLRRTTTSGPRVALLGDSIIDNGSYVPRGETVTDWLVHALVERDMSFSVDTLARDGGVVRSVPNQLKGLKPGTTHVVLCVGGNDASGSQSLLGHKVRDVGEALIALGALQSRFHEIYHALVSGLVTMLPSDTNIALCTVYDSAQHDPAHQIEVETGLNMFNAAIVRTASELGCDLIDLRTIFTERADYANPIEPSSRGGWKLAQAIATWVKDGPALVGGHEVPDIPETLAFGVKEWNLQRGAYTPSNDPTLAAWGEWGPGVGGIDHLLDWDQPVPSGAEVVEDEPKPWLVSFTPSEHAGQTLVQRDWLVEARMQEEAEAVFLSALSSELGIDRKRVAYASPTSYTVLIDGNEVGEVDSVVEADVVDLPPALPERDPDTDAYERPDDVSRGAVEDTAYEAEREQLEEETGPGLEQPTAVEGERR